jgi:segregation and condensation protein B
MAMDQEQLKHIVEAALLASGRPLSLDELRGLFGESPACSRADLRGAIEALQSDYANRGITVREVASGFRIEVRSSMGAWLAKLWEERPARYSRALMETLAIIAYRQPVTRGDVEEIRGVAVTTNIIRTLLERSWVRVVGYRDVPGKPAMYGTTREFLDYFGLKQLDDLPPLAEIRDMDRLTSQLELAAAEAAVDAPPGVPAALVQPLPAGLPTEPATVTYLDEARTAGCDETPQADVSQSPVRATVVPLKTR